MLTDSVSMYEEEDNLRQQLNAIKNDLLKKVQLALAEAGLDDCEVGSIGIFVRKQPRRCPQGQEPVWEPVRKPDGTIVYEWVCKTSG